MAAKTNRTAYTNVGCLTLRPMSAPVRLRCAEMVQGWCDESEALLRSGKASP